MNYWKNFRCTFPTALSSNTRRVLTNPVILSKKFCSSVYASNSVCKVGSSRCFSTSATKCSKKSKSDEAELTHVDAAGKAVMVDVGDKKITEREATAVAIVYLPEEVFKRVRENSLKKGDVLSIAQIAGIMGAKHTSTLIPLCHNIVLDQVYVECRLVDVFDDIRDQRRFSGLCTGAVRITCTAKCTGKTGVEMEALTGASVAALCVYDMCKAVSHEVTFFVRLESKTGGKTDFQSANESNDGKIFAGGS